LVTERSTDGDIPKIQFRPRDPVSYNAVVKNSSAFSVTGELVHEIKDGRGQTMLAATVSRVFEPGDNIIELPSFVPTNATTGIYTYTASLHVGGTIRVKSLVFEVLQGATTATIVQETPSSTSIDNVFKVAFRPDETVRFIVVISNFITQPVPATLSYQLTGPGNALAGSGSTSFTAAFGLFAMAVDMPIPESALGGLYVFRSSLSANGSQQVKGMMVTVVPRNPSETLDLDGVFVTDENHQPITASPAGRKILLNTSRLSLSATSSPVSLRYRLSSSSGTVIDEVFNITVPAGRSNGSVPVDLPANAVGTYAFQGVLTWQDHAHVTRTSMLSTPFSVGPNPPAEPPTITLRRPHITDINLVPRATLSPGENFVISRTVYSTSAIPLSGGVRYVVKSPQGFTFYDQTIPATFYAGENTALIGFTVSTNQTLTTLNITVTASAQGQSSTQTVSFSYSGPPAPPRLF
jgi:hypothetical protein